MRRPDPATTAYGTEVFAVVKLVLISVIGVDLVGWPMRVEDVATEMGPAAVSQ